MIKNDGTFVDPVSHTNPSNYYIKYLAGCECSGPTNISNRFSVERTRASTRCQRYCQRLRPAVAERVRGAAQVFGMVMTVNAIKHLDRHAEKAGRLPFVDAVLHQPGRRGVTQGVRTDPSAQKELPGPRDRAISAYFALVQFAVAMPVRSVAKCRQPFPI